MNENLFAWYLSLDCMVIFHTEFEALTVTEDEVSDGLVLPTQDSNLQQDRTQEDPKASVLLPGDFFEEIENETGILGSRKINYVVILFIKHKWIINLGLKKKEEVRLPFSNRPKYRKIRVSFFFFFLIHNFAFLNKNVKISEYIVTVPKRHFNQI